MDRLPDVDPSTAVERVDTRSTQIVGPDPGAGRQAPRALSAQYGRAEVLEVIEHGESTA